MPFPFEVGFDEVRSDLDAYVDAVFGCLESEFLVMPKGEGFVEFPAFEAGYETLKRATVGFQEVTPDTVCPVVFETPIALIVLRCMLGFTPPEWAWYPNHHTGVEVTQSSARTIDRSIRRNPGADLPKKGTVTERRIRALVAAACHALESGVPEDAPTSLHRLDKADTRRDLSASARPRAWVSPIPFCSTSVFSDARSPGTAIPSASWSEISSRTPSKTNCPERTSAFARPSARSDYPGSTRHRTSSSQMSSIRMSSSRRSSPKTTEQPATR